MDDNDLMVRKPPLLVGKRAKALDIMLVDDDPQRSLLTRLDLEESLDLRCAQRNSGREAVALFSRVRCDAIVCRTLLGDIDCWRFIRMIRSGRFGYSGTPVVVLCDGAEHAALSPMLDEHTSLIVDDDPAALVDELKSVSTGAAKSSVLIVEDEQLAAQATANALDKFYRVDVANDGRAALAAWRMARHSLVLLDLTLPGISGEEVLAEIMKEHPGQAVIVLTAYDDPQKHQELVLAGAADFVSKPVAVHDLPGLCERTLRAKQCLINADRSRAEAATASDVAARIKIANYYIERGEPALCSAHLRRAILDYRRHEPSEDQWHQLLSEFRC